jgi:hypothetical protein
MVGLPGGVVSDVVGASAFLGGSWKFWQTSACLHAAPQRVLTYPPYSTNPEAMRKALATGCTPIPACIGPVGAQEVLQKRLGMFARHRRYL